MSSDYNSHSIPPEYAPISMWGYFGYEILFSIPCIGIIFLIVFALSAKNVNLKNFARSYFCFIIIGLLVLGVVFAIASATGTLGALVEQMQMQ